MNNIKNIKEKKQLANDSCNWWKSQYDDVMSDCDNIESKIEQWGCTPDLKDQLDKCEEKIDYLINKGKFEVKNLEYVHNQEQMYWHNIPKNNKTSWQYTVYKNGKKVRESKSNNSIHEDNDKVKKIREYDKRKYDKRRKDELDRGTDEKE